MGSLRDILEGSCTWGNASVRRAARREEQEGERSGREGVGGNGREIGGGKEMDGEEKKH